MKTIPLTQGKVALVDDADYERVSEFKWCAVKDEHRWYARRLTWDKAKKKAGKWVHLHRFVYGQDIRLDHKNGNGLDNRRENLRPCSTFQNSGNARKQSGTSSQFRGVTWSGKDSLWVAQIAPHRQKEVLGYFKDEMLAAKAYDAAARRHWGDFARVNFQ